MVNDSTVLRKVNFKRLHLSANMKLQSAFGPPAGVAAVNELSHDLQTERWNCTVDNH